MKILESFVLFGFGFLAADRLDKLSRDINIDALDR